MALLCHQAAQESLSCRNSFRLLPSNRQTKENAAGYHQQTKSEPPPHKLSVLPLLRTNHNPIITQQRTIHRPPPIPILRMEQHMHAIMIHIRASGSSQAIPIPSLEQRLRGARVGACHGFGSRVVHVVVCVHVAVGGEEEEPGSIVVHEVGGFDDAFVRGPFVVEDCGGGAEEGCAGGGEALDAEGGGDYGCDCGCVRNMMMGFGRLG